MIKGSWEYERQVHLKKARSALMKSLDELDTVVTELRISESTREADEAQVNWKNLMSLLQKLRKEE